MSTAPRKGTACHVPAKTAQGHQPLPEEHGASSVVPTPDPSLVTCLRNRGDCPRGGRTAGGACPEDPAVWCIYLSPSSSARLL